MVIDLEKYDLTGALKETVSLEQILAKETRDPSRLVKEWVVKYRNNQRQWSASTKTRSEVVGSKRKIRQQKGSGRARAGTISAPQRVGGGRVGTPRPKFDQSTWLNKKEAKIAFGIILEDLMKNKKVFMIDSFDMDSPKTSIMCKLFSKLEISRAPLILYGPEERDSVKNVAKSIKNIQEAKIANAIDVNIYELLFARGLIITQSALDCLRKRAN